MNLASFIDHTLLSQTASETDIKKLCDEAIQYKFATVCINPYWVGTASFRLENTGVGVTTVIGFPLGAVTLNDKEIEILNAAENGATEFDIVANIGAIKSNKFDVVDYEIKYLSNLIRERGLGISKIIVESSQLTQPEKEVVFTSVANSEANFIKTSTGFNDTKALIGDVFMMRSMMPTYIEVKASGGIKNRVQAETFLASGATRLGTSSGVAIVTNNKFGFGSSNY